MHFSKNIYTKESLLGMLELSIESMAENSLCHYCIYSTNQQPEICNDTDLCKSAIFEGLSKIILSKE